MSAQKKQKLGKEESPVLLKKIMHRDYCPSPNTLVMWGVPKSKVKPHIDWTNGTTRPAYRMVPVQFQCHRPKSKSTLDVSMVYREDMARDASKQLRLGAEDMGFFVVNGLVPRLKESNMLQLGNTVLIFPVEGSLNTFLLDIRPSMCPYCEQAMETGEFVECEGCDAHAHRQCVSTIWADDELQKTPSGATAGAASQQPFKFACPACEAREPAVSYSETCTMQTTTQNGHHVPGFRPGVNPLKRPLPGMDAPSQPSSLHPHSQAGTSTAVPLPSHTSTAAAPASGAAGPKADAPQKATSAHRAVGLAGGQLPPSPLRSRPSPSPSATTAAPGTTTAAQPPGPPSGSGSGSGPGSVHVAALRALGNSGGSTAAGGAAGAGLQHKEAGGHAAAEQADTRKQAVPPGPPPPQTSPASQQQQQQQQTPSAPASGRGPTSGTTTTPHQPSSAALATPTTNGVQATPGSSDVAARKAPESQRSAAKIIAKMSKLKQDLEDRIADIEGLSKEVEQVRKELAASQAEQSASETAQAALRAENAQLKEEAGSSAPGELDAARSEAAAAREQAEEANKRAQECEEQLRHMQGQLDQQTQQSQAAEASQTGILAELEQLRATLNTERANAALQAADVETLRQRCAEQDAELKALEEATLDTME
ncbi:hypothetical protein DUNSADRAFT_10833 [Dunaliella salina]|uniref:Zinc finger PHD-type domain-containing protein n=1 Tax=Dunaliella salina TaxID=3046 RepID=A0ABQ7H9Y0_DUNSA|nr:hypothetical protein DUNSADRAFT_10833 [Dunaliella salina]|eukprot:KAF5843659.1 hypothetical protein DUNSADRAFT_10833 [Dunaliella salina]